MGTPAWRIRFRRCRRRATTFWPYGAHDTTTVTDQLPLPFGRGGTGLAIAHHVDVATTVFIQETGIDVDAYCVLCGP